MHIAVELWLVCGWFKSIIIESSHIYCMVIKCLDETMHWFAQIGSNEDPFEGKIYVKIVKLDFGLFCSFD